MKKNSFTWFFFNLAIMTCLLHGPEVVYAQTPLLSNETNLEEIQATLTVIKDLYREIDETPHEFHADLVVQVIVILIEMYQKIVEATVTHYLMPNVSAKQNLHDIIVKIIAEDVLKIIGILCKEFIHFIFNHEMSWQEKVCHCAWVLSVILIIKVGIEKIPTNLKPAEISGGVENKNTDKSAWPTVQTDISR